MMKNFFKSFGRVLIGVAIGCAFLIIVGGYFGDTVGTLVFYGGFLFLSIILIRSKSGIAQAAGWLILAFWVTLIGANFFWGK